MVTKRRRGESFSIPEIKRVLWGRKRRRLPLSLLEKESGKEKKKSLLTSPRSEKSRLHGGVALAYYLSLWKGEGRKGEL